MTAFGGRCQENAILALLRPRSPCRRSQPRLRESIDRLPLPAGRESDFELLCVVRFLDALHGSSGQTLLLLPWGSDTICPRQARTFPSFATWFDPRTQRAAPGSASARRTEEE